MDELLMWIIKYISTGYFDDYILDVIKKLSTEEKVKLFSDENILRKLDTIVDYEYMARLFSEMSAEIQEITWNNIHCQKLLLGIDASSDQMLQKLISTKKISAYYIPIKLRAFEAFVTNIKSPKILEQLPYNSYFIMFILYSTHIPESFYLKVDIELTFKQIITSDMYKTLDNEARKKLIEKINYNYPKVLLPPDIKDLFMPTQTYSTFFFGEQGKTLGAMLNTKIDELQKKGLKLDIDYQTFKSLNIYEINILISDTTGVVNQCIINEYLSKLVDELLANGTFYTGRYLDTTYLSGTLHRTIYKMFIEKTIGNPNYESKALAYLFTILFPNTKDKYNEEEKKELMLLLKNALVNADDNTLTDLFKNINDSKSVFFCRFELATELGLYLNGISVHQLLKINIKHVNKIFVLLSKLKEFDGVAAFKALAIKMYLVFGLDKSIELLSGNYPINKTFLDNVNELDVSHVEFKKDGKKYLPLIHEEFYRFMFGAGHIDLLFDELSLFSIKWYYLYNKFSKIKALCDGHLSSRKVEKILANRLVEIEEQSGDSLAELASELLEYRNSRDRKFVNKLAPNCWRLHNILPKILLDRTILGVDDANALLEVISDVYSQQIKRVKSTIPHIKGSLPNGWSYGLATYDSEAVYEVGIDANCCFKIKGEGHNHLLHALLTKNGGILFIYTPRGAIAAFSPLKRNGELLIANSIEPIPTFGTSEKIIIDVFEVCIKRICQTSKECEDNGYLKVAAIGADAEYKPQGIPWPDNIPTPTILEKNNLTYAETDKYHKRLTVFYTDGDIDLSKLKYGQVEPIYMDSRKKVLFCVNDGTNLLLQRQMLRMIESIRYTKWIDSGNNKDNFQSLFLISGATLYCNSDWFVIVRYDGSIYYECLEDDPRARGEMEQVLAFIKNNTPTQSIGILKPLTLTQITPTANKL